MKSRKHGKSTSLVEISITRFGLWLYVKNKEYFLSFEEYPFFQKAILQDIYNVELLHDTHLYWPELDADLSLDILKNPRSFPLIDRSPPRTARGKVKPRRNAKKDRSSEIF